jgi:hypothetical protein
MLLHQVLHDEPRPPRKLNDRIPRDLETICLKAMIKEPARRYATAQELADDLRRWLRGEPIKARPVGRLERAWRGCRRNPVVAGLTAAGVLSLVGGTVTASVLAVRMYHHAREADENARLADRNARLAEERAEAERRTRLDERKARYADAMVGIVEAFERGDVVAVQQLLETLVPGPGEEDVRGIDWHILWNLVHGYRLSVGGPDRPCHTAAFVEGGTLLATAGQGHVTLYDTATGQERALLARDPQTRYFLLTTGPGRAAVLGTEPKRLRLWALEGQSLRQLLEVPHERETRFLAAAITPNLRRFAVLTLPTGVSASTPRTLSIWDLPAGQRQEGLPQLDGMLAQLAFAPDGRTLAIGLAQPLVPNPVHLLDLESGKVKATLNGHTGIIRAIAFTGDGERVVTGDEHRSVRVWDTATGTRPGWGAWPCRPTAKPWRPPPARGPGRSACGTWRRGSTSARSGATRRCPCSRRSLPTGPRWQPATRAAGCCCGSRGPTFAWDIAPPFPPRARACRRSRSRRTASEQPAAAPTTPCGCGAWKGSRS